MDTTKPMIASIELKDLPTPFESDPRYLAFVDAFKDDAFMSKMIDRIKLEDFDSALNVITSREAATRVSPENVAALREYVESMRTAMASVPGGHSARVVEAAAYLALSDDDKSYLKRQRIDADRHIGLQALAFETLVYEGRAALEDLMRRYGIETDVEQVSATPVDTIVDDVRGQIGKQGIL